MGFWGKASKITGFTMLGVGLAGTVGFGALLGVGANAKYKMPDVPTTTVVEKATSPAFSMPIIEAGIGAMNYGELYVNGRMVDKKGTIDNLKLPEVIKNMLKELVDNKESYNSFVDEARDRKSITEEQLNKSGLSPQNKLILENKLDLYNHIIKAYDKSLAGGLLTSFCIISVIISIPLIIIGKKKAKQA